MRPDQEETSKYLACLQSQDPQRRVQKDEERVMTPEQRAFLAAWKICSAWDGKITKPVLRKAIAAYVKEIEARKGVENAD
jgi:hypothetical protein